MCNAEKKSLLQEETGNDMEIVRIEVGGSETTSQLPLSPKTAESGGVTPFAGPSKRLKMAILCAVTLQNAGYALVRRYSRGYLRETYSASSALFVMEMAKLLLSAVYVCTSDAPSDVPSGTPLSKYAHLIRHSAKMAVPAVIYLIMNLLGFLSLAHIDASTFAIVSQMKVFTTAIFAVALLGRKLHLRRWRALLSLTLGVILISSETSPASVMDAAASAASQIEAWRHYSIGMAAAAGDVILSGFASIYFERVLKSVEETYSVWDRNFQLAFWSASIYLPILIYDNPTNPFVGWSYVAVLCSAVGALGGVLVALSIKYTDSILKTIATTGSIVLTTLLNAAFLSGPLNLAIVVGALVVVVAVFGYNDNGDR